MTEKKDLNIRIWLYNVGLNWASQQNYLMNLQVTWAIPPPIIKKQWDVIGRYSPVKVGPIGDIKGYKGKYIWKEAISNQISYSKIAAEIIPEVKQEISTQT